MFQQLHPIIKAKKRAIVRMNHNLLLFKTMRLHQFVQVRTNKGAAAPNFISRTSPSRVALPGIPHDIRHLPVV